MTTTLHKNWLIVTAIVVGAFGPVFALGTRLATSGPAQFTLDVLAWPVDGAQDYQAATTRFLTALTGGFLLGWGVTILCLRQWVFDAAPEGVRRSVLVGLIAWFVLDSAGSIASGNPINAVFNVIVLALASGPLWVPARNSAPPARDRAVKAGQ